LVKDFQKLLKFNYIRFVVVWIMCLNVLRKLLSNHISKDSILEKMVAITVTDRSDWLCDRNVLS